MMHALQEPVVTDEAPIIRLLLYIVIYPSMMREVRLVMYNHVAYLVVKR